MGKQKIVIEKIEDKQKRSVAFCKRREGLFKKAETASRMFGAQIGIITFSPAGKPFVFSTSNSSSLDSIIDRFMSASSSSPSMIVGNKRNGSSIDRDVDHVNEVSERNHKKQKITQFMDATDIPKEEEENDEGTRNESMSPMNEGEEVGGSDEYEDGLTVEEWENILNTTPNAVCDSMLTSSSSLNQEEVAEVGDEDGLVNQDIVVGGDEVVVGGDEVVVGGDEDWLNEKFLEHLLS